MRRRLFDVTSTGEVFPGWYTKALADIAALPSDAVLMSSFDELEEALVARYWIDPLALHWDLRRGDPFQSLIDREEVATGAATEDHAVSEPSATAIVEFIPFSGAAGLFDMRPSNPPFEPVCGSVRDDGLALYWVDTHPRARGDRPDLDRQEARLKTWVSAVNRDVASYNTELRRVVRAALKERFDQLRASADALAELGIPLRQRGVPHEQISRDGRRQRVSPDTFVSMPRRGRGRPGWTRELFEERWAEACRLTPAPRTYPALAKRFRALDGAVGSITGDHLGRLHRRFVGQGQ